MVRRVAVTFQGIRAHKELRIIFRHYRIIYGRAPQKMQRGAWPVKEFHHKLYGLAIV